jgi:uncharacterized protein YggU (UPF0235/DUF167 family)
MARIRVWVKPGSARDALDWDPWRERWVVGCRAPAVGGQANRAVAALLAEWLGVPPSSVHWVHAGSSSAKELEAIDLAGAKVEERLRARLRKPAAPPR